VNFILISISLSLVSTYL